MKAGPGANAWSAENRSLEGGALLANSIWNLAGEAAPLVVAVVAFPVLVRAMGTERFGILAMLWAIIGYFGLFDLGLGRALTKLVAEKMALGEMSSIPAFFWASIFMMCACGTVVGVAMFLFAHRLAFDMLKMPPALRLEAVHALELTAVAMPAVVSSSALRGMCAAYHRFDLLNGVRIPLSVYSFLAPMVTVAFTHSIALIIGVVIAGRAVSWAVQLALCFVVEPGLRDTRKFTRAEMAELIGFGGWLTLAGIIRASTVYCDRLIIGATASMSAVAYYSTPLEMLVKLEIIPAAVSQVMFPALSHGLARYRDRALEVFERINRYVLGTLIIPTLAMVSFAPQVLGFWLGHRFAVHSSMVAGYLAVGILLSGATYVPAAILLAAGRPDVIAWISIAIAPLYVPFMWAMTRHYGIQGTSIAFVLHGIVVAVAIWAAVGWLLCELRVEIKRDLIWLGATTCVLSTGPLLPPDAMSRTIFFILALCTFCGAGWLLLLRDAERRLIVARIRSMRMGATANLLR